MTMTRDVTVTHGQLRAGETELHAALEVLRGHGLKVPSVALREVGKAWVPRLVMNLVRQDNGYDRVRLLAYPDRVVFRFETDQDANREGAD